MQVSIPHELAPGARWYLVHARPNSEPCRSTVATRACGVRKIGGWYLNLVTAAALAKDVRAAPRYSTQWSYGKPPLMELADGNAC
jgi:hypothetical protein